MGELALRGEDELFSSGKAEREEKIRSFIPSIFIICPLPIRSINENEKVYVRKYNNFEMKLVGTNGIPGGKTARDMLMLFTTEAVYKKNEESKGVNLTFNNLEELRKILNINRRNYGEIVLDMLEKFAGCMINFQAKKRFEFDGQTLLFDENVNEAVKKYNAKGNSLMQKNLVNVPFIYKLKNIDILKEGRKKGKPVIIQIEITDQFVNLVKNNAVPVDFNVYREIRSSIEKDLYVWFVFRNYVDRVKGKSEIYISRRNLLDQFGDEIETNERVKYQRILEAIYSIKTNYYKDLNFKVVNERKSDDKGIILYKSQLVIQEKDVKYVPLLTKIN